MAKAVTNLKKAWVVAILAGVLLGDAAHADLISGINTREVIAEAETHISDDGDSDLGDINATGMADVTIGSTSPSAMTAYTLTGDNLTSAVLETEIEQSLATLLGGFALSSGEYKFTANENATFAISGMYDFALSNPDAPNVSTEMNLTVEFRDLTDNDDLFTNVQFIEGAASQIFTVGGEEGDFSVLSGALNGDLIAGHEYEFFYEWTIANPGPSESSNDYPGEATGWLNLEINAIPAPGAALLAIVGFGFVGWAKRRVVP